MAALVGASDLGCLYEVGVDLYYNDGNGNQVRITQSGGVAGSPGSIANLASPASATYVSANQTFVWQSAASTPANMDGGSVIIRNITASSNGITLSAPVALASNYTITLPALPAQTNVMTIDSSGNMGSTTWNAVGQNMTATGANAIAATRTRSTNAATVGVGGIAISASSGGAANTSSPSFSQINNLSVTITTSGRPVWVGLVGDASLNPASAQSYLRVSPGIFNILLGYYALYRSSTLVSVYILGSGASTNQGNEVYVPCSALQSVDFSVAGSAGTYTYTAQYRNDVTSTATVYCINAKLVAYEL